MMQTSPASRAPGASPQVGADLLQAAFAVMGRHQVEDLRAPTAYELCLGPFLNAIGWIGEPRRVVEALPHFDPVGDLNDFRLALANLGVATQFRLEQLDALPDDALPCLVDGEDGPVVILGRCGPGRFRVFRGSDGTHQEIDAPQRVAHICTPSANSDDTRPDQSFIRSVFGPIRQKIPFLLLLTFFINLMALATPLFSMAVYNNIIVSEQITTLAFALTGLMFAFIFEDRVRRMRTELIATNGARLNATMLQETFSRVLQLPLSMTLAAPVSTQISRLKQFESVAGACNSAAATSILDLPFTLVFLIAIGVIAGPLVYVPLALLTLFTALALIATPTTRAYALHAGKRRSDAQALARQTILDAEIIRGLCAERIWLKRLTAAIRAASASRRRAAYFDQMLNALAQMFTSIAGVSTLFAGTLLVIQGDLSIGGLIATMMLVWRLAAPPQTALLSAHHILSARDAARQAERLMQLPTERGALQQARVFRRFNGAIRFDSVAFRYPSAADFALRGLTMDVEPGQMVSIIGPTGAGKSTLLKLMLGLYRPTGGTILLDGLNLSQIDPSEVRAQVGYCGEEAHLFFGTVAQNIRLAHPYAGDDEIAAEQASLGLDTALTEAFGDTSPRLDAATLARMPESVQRRIGLARALIKPAPVLLLDSPTERLEPKEVDQLLNRLAELKGAATTLVVTTKRELIEMSDRVVVLDAGKVLTEGPPQEILGKLDGGSA